MSDEITDLPDGQFDFMDWYPLTDDKSEPFHVRATDGSSVFEIKRVPVPQFQLEASAIIDGKTLTTLHATLQGAFTWCDNRKKDHGN